MTANDLDPVSARFAQRLRVLRRERNWSLDALAKTSGVSRSMISQIERGAANPTLATTVKIARAFGLGLGELVQDREQRSPIDVIRHDDPVYHYRSDEPCSIRTLSPLHLEKDVEFYELRLQPEAELRSAAHFAGTREFLSVTRGQVQLTVDGDQAKLRRGDSASYLADRPHLIANRGRGDSLAFLVVIYTGG